ncbi:MAG: serine/threonine-protein kinase, partial [Myxococcota bacterium]
KLSHPNVVSVFDVGEHEGQRFIAMEFVDGQTMRVWLSHERTQAQILEVFLAAGRGLSAAHAVGLVHRDFKPDNVLVGQDGRPRVLDFGLARPPDAAGGGPPALPPDADPFATTMTHAGLLLGTPAYMAPEQHLGDPADARSDQFAFAVALFEALTGVLPFAGEDLRTLSLSVVRGRVVEPPPGRMSHAIRALLLRALSVDPSARFATIDALLEGLQAACDPGGISFDTAQVDQVLARAAQLQAGASHRPGLSPAEVEAVAVEAGIDPAHARQAAGEALVPAPQPQAMPAATQSATAPVPSPPSFSWLTWVTRRTGPVPPEVARLLIRRLESQVGRGKTEQLGASTSWRSGSLELHIDPTAMGAELVLQRRAGLLAKSRPWRYGIVGVGLFVALIVPFCVEVLGFDDGEVVPIVFGSMWLGAYLGRRFAAWVHDRECERQRLELSATADRLVALAGANYG